jgi:acyl carrier protein
LTIKIFEKQIIPQHKNRQQAQPYVGRKGHAMLEKMLPIIAEHLNVEESEIKLESNFKEDLGADSLDLFELVMGLEEEFGVEIPSEDLESIATVNDVVEYLKAKGVQE